MISDTELDERFEKADAAARITASDGALEEVFLRSKKAAGKRQSRYRAALGAGIAGVIILAAGAPVAATALHEFLVQDVDAQAGAGTERVSGSENIDTGGPDIREYIDSIYPDDLPLPQGYTRESVVATVTALNESNPGLTQSIRLTYQLETVSYCGWVDQWLTADAVGDSAKRDAAADVMADSLTWQGYTTTDAGGVIEAQRSFADGAAAGDRGAVLAAQAVNACSELSAAAK